MSEPSGRHPQDYPFQPDGRFQVEQWSANVDDTEVSYAADHDNAKDNDLLMTTTADRVPLVDYLVLGEPPYLRARACTSCGARYFDRRNACASCFATEFADVALPTEGVLRAFTIVAFAAPGVAVPFVAGVIDCDGTSVRGNVINTPLDPDHVRLGMKVRLTTYAVGTDDNGVEAVGFGFEPMEV